MAELDGRAADRDATHVTSVASTDREPNRWAVLALLSVAQLMVVLDATIVTIAIPSAQESLHFSTESRVALQPLRRNACWQHCQGRLRTENHR